MTIPGKDDGPRVANIGKLAAHLVVGQDGDLDGGVLDAVVIVDAGKGLETVGATDGKQGRRNVQYDAQ